MTPPVNDSNDPIPTFIYAVTFTLGDGLGDLRILAWADSRDSGVLRAYRLAASILQPVALAKLAGGCTVEERGPVPIPAPPDRKGNE